MDKILEWILGSAVGIIWGLVFWRSYKDSRIEKDLWRKGFEDAKNTSDQSIDDLIREENKRPR